MLLRTPPPNNLQQYFQANGFLLLEVSSELKDSIQDAFEAALPFFRSTLSEKMANKLPEEMGYRPFGIEYSRVPTAPDQIESFSMTARHPEAEVNLPSQSAQLLGARLSKTFDALESIAELLAVQLAAEMSDRPLAPVLRGTFRRWSRLQVNYSRPVEVASSFINEVHEDGNLITIACSTGPGLEIRTSSHEFTQITTTPGQMVVMPGEIAWLLSGGRVPPLYHRVRPEPIVKERMALLFFGDIDPLACEPWIRNEINSHIDIGDRVLRSVNRFGLKTFETK
jgi:isopenicillin N synthase-like dioxygenase